MAIACKPDQVDVKLNIEVYNDNQSNIFVYEKLITVLLVLCCSRVTYLL